MTTFVVRIELHDATWNDYTQLYGAAAKLGFTDVIVSDDGRKFKLSPGEYELIANLTPAQVLAKAKSAASATGKRYAVFVTQAAACTWEGLKAA